MSYLDQLKKKAEDVKAQEMAAGRSHEQLEARFEELVLPTLRKMQIYFKEAAEQLNYIKPDTKVVFNIKGVGDFEFNQDEYINGKIDNKRNEFFFRIIAQSRKRPRVTINELAMVSKYQKYLNKHNLPFKVGQVNNKRNQFVRAVFELQGTTYTEFTFTAEFNHSAIDIKARNFAELGTVNYRVPAEKFDDAFLDKCAMFLTRASDENVLQPYSIQTVWGHQVPPVRKNSVSDADKERQMKEQILAELREKHKEATEQLAQAQQVDNEASTPKPEEEKKGFLGGLFGKR